MKNKEFKKTSGALFIVLAVFLLGIHVTAASEDLAAFYKGKTMRFIVGWSPGGGYDAYARLLTSQLEKRLNCTPIVQNMPGAGGLVAMNYMYNTAKKNGLFISITPTGLPLTQAIGTRGVKFDCTRFNWMVSIVRDTHVIGVAPDSPYKSLKDLQAVKSLKGGTTDVTSPLGQPLVMAAEALGMDHMKIVSGYPGTSECFLAVQRGEVDFTAGSIHHYLKKKAPLRPLAAISEKRNPKLPDVPALTEFGIKKGAERMLEILFAARGSGRGIITAPGVPKEKVDFLRKILIGCLEDKELLKRAKKVNLDIDPLSGKEAQAIAEKAMRLTPDDIKQLKHLLFEKYM
jgi:tripartite-type tricarboxylate transporter receptor subunit TctC